MSTVRIRYSKNGGNTWSDWRIRPLGDPGDFARITRWFRFGQARGWTFETSVTDPVPADLIAASVQIEGVQ